MMDAVFGRSLRAATSTGKLIGRFAPAGGMQLRKVLVHLLQLLSRYIEAVEFRDEGIFEGPDGHDYGSHRSIHNDLALGIERDLDGAFPCREDVLPRHEESVALVGAGRVA